ncbi:MAG: peptide ligase PGM1-related protein [Nocardioidaceae bacterium]
MTTHSSTPVLPTQRRTLAELDENERYLRFDELQSRMPQVWERMRLDLDDECVVVVPSLSLARSTASSSALVQAMEERALFLLLLLRQPRLRLVYVTSLPVPEAVVQYYLGLLPGVIPSHARARLHLIAVGDGSVQPLSAKLLARPRLLRHVRALVPNPERAHLIAYNTTRLERDVAVSLGIPLYGSDPRFEPLGTKTGCRRMFEELGVPCPQGAEDLHSVPDLVRALGVMRAARPAMAQAIVKLNDGVSGAGNAIVRLTELPTPGGPAEAGAVEARVRTLDPEDASLTPESYLAAFAADGGIVEERILGEEITSPSVQLRVLPDGTLELLSTHDQLLGGPSGQSYLGCSFPADPGYSRLIVPPAMAIGRHLAEQGVIGRFAVDFVVVRDLTGAWTPYAIELNLRKGGTTHPFLTLQFLTDGRYDGDRGLFLTPDGRSKHLVATDHLEHPALRALTAEDLFDLVADHGLHFDHARATGVVFHMFSALTEEGRLGLTAVADTAEAARAMFDRASDLVVQEGHRALAQAPLV